MSPDRPSSGRSLASTVWIPLLLTACAGAVPAAERAPSADAEARIVEVPSGRVVGFDEMVAALARARAVYVGERHDEASDHEAQLRIAEALAQRPGSTALGFEMFQVPRQAHLDAYVEGAIDEATLLERTEWERRWGFDFALYRPLVELARAGHLPMVALNATQELSRAVARDGLEGLDEEQRAHLPELDLGVESHREAVMAALREHPGLSEERLERFYLAQVLWDETMAERVAATLATDGGPTRMVVFAGTMHARRSAIPDRAARRGASPSAIVLPVVESELEELLAEHPPVADYLVVYPDPPPEPPSEHPAVAPGATAQNENP